MHNNRNTNKRFFIHPQGGDYYDNDDPISNSIILKHIQQLRRDIHHVKGITKGSVFTVPTLSALQTHPNQFLDI